MTTPITNIDNVNHTYMQGTDKYALSPTTGNFELASTLATPAPATVNQSQIQNQTPMTLPVTPTTPYSGFVASQQTTADNAETDSNKATNDYSGLLSSLSDLQNQDANRGADQIANENAQGIPGMGQNILDLQQKAGQSKLAYDLAAQTVPYSLEAQGRGITSTVLRGQEAVIQRKQQQAAAIDNLVQNSNLQAAQGNLQYAQSLADRATALKYDPIEQKIKNAQSLLTNYSSLMTSAQKKAADEKSTLLSLQLKQVEDQRAQEDGVNKIGLELAKQGVDTSLLKGVTNVNDALAIAGPQLKGQNNEIVKVGDAAYLIDKNTGKIVQSYGAPTGGSGGSGTVNPQYVGIISTILGSGKFTKDQSAAITKAIQNGEDPATVIKNNAKSIMGTTEASKVTNFEVARDTMNDINTALQAYYAGGGQTSLLKGNYEDVLGKLGTVNDPKLRSLAIQIASGLQIYRNAVSGTAYSVQEGQQIQAIFPGIDNSKGLNDAIIAGRKAAFDSVIDNSYKAVLGKGYDQLKTASTPSKGTLDDRSFVAQAVQNYGKPYETIINATPQGQIPVAQNSDGSIGYIPIEEFNPSLYTKL